MSTEPIRDVLLEVEGLRTHFFADEGTVKAVDGVDLTVRRGTTLCVVGESGSGKSITARSILRIIDAPGRIIGGSIRFHPTPGTSVDLVKLSERGREIRAIRGRAISMIFQEPMSSLSPVHTIGNQIIETIRLHLKVDQRQAKARAVEVLERVGLPRAETRLDSYPFELSGGMRQRVCIAVALACEPQLLIADEPTTALDVTTQANILDLIKDLQREMGMAVLFITHDLGVVAEIADDVAVMYLGRVVERGDADSIFHDAQHPYTRALLRSIPRLSPGAKGKLESIRGMAPHPYERPNGCLFHTRCREFMPGVCDELVPPAEHIGVRREVRCLLHSDVSAVRATDVREATG